MKNMFSINFLFRFFQKQLIRDRKTMIIIRESLQNAEDEPVRRAIEQLSEEIDLAERFSQIAADLRALISRNPVRKDFFH